MSNNERIYLTSISYIYELKEIDEIIVEVNGDHIERGVRGCKERCPLALAIKEVRKNLYSPLILNDYAIFGNECWVMSSTAKKFVNKFDSGEDVSPSRFLLRKLPERKVNDVEGDNV